MSSARVAGGDRYSTSVSISQAAFPTANIGSGVPVLFVASGENFPDALSAGPVVSQLGGPVLLTAAATLPASVREEIIRLRPATIAVIGGVGAVSATVFQQLQSLAPSVVRLGGASRYETSRLVTEYGFSRSGARVAYIAAGEGFADALAAGAAAGSKNAPIILVPGQAGSVDAATLTLLRNLQVTQIFVVGGEGAVSAGVANSLRGVAPVVRLSGGDRLATAQAVNREAFGDAQRAYLAYAFNFPDALGGGVLATVRPGPLFTVPGDCVPEAVLGEIRRVGASEVVLLGGAGVLNARVAALTPCS
jgi:putative cell wall-binding protein